MPARFQLHRIAAALAGLLLGGAACQAQQEDPKIDQLERTIATLTEKNLALQKSLAEANRSEKEASEQLSKVRERLGALGKNLLDGGNDRLVQAASDIEVLRERHSSLEGACMRLSATVIDYLRQAVTSDPDARVRVEAAVRELDSALGLRTKPRADVRSGSLQQAKVVSIDSESGLLVLNAGEAEGVRTGMTFRLVRGDLPFGKAIVADVRKNVSGLFVETLDNNSDRVRMGDTASLVTQSE